jgi:signal transduction histidine kinase
MDDAFAKDLAAVARLDVVPKILEVVCRSTGMGFAAVARVTHDRWIACAVRDEIAFGLEPGGELQIATTICNEIRDSGQAVVIDQVSQDPVFRDHHTPRMYGFESYISTPILHEGQFFGTLCAIDPRPADLRGPQTLAMFELFAALIGSHLDAQEQIERSEAALMSERETADLREQFIAVLGHDLRNPLAAISGGTRLLKRGQAPDKSSMILDQMELSVGRMVGLINDVMDFARARLGGGFDIEVKDQAPVEAALEQVVSEFRTSVPTRTVEADIAVTQLVACDTRRVAQLFSNLVANALAHGSQDAPVKVRARTEDGRFSLAVGNQGSTMSEETMRKLFLPFTRAASGRKQQGLGLGLYIAAEIARAHGGELTVRSEDGEIWFTFSMPLAN